MRMVPLLKPLDDTGLHRDMPPDMCRHTPPCPTAGSTDAAAARVVTSHPGQGWSVLCNGLVAFEDTGDLLPDGAVVAPRRHLTVVV